MPLAVEKESVLLKGGTKGTIKRHDDLRLVRELTDRLGTMKEKWGITAVKKGGHEKCFPTPGRQCKCTIKGEQAVKKMGAHLGQNKGRRGGT